jgi:hypothetical protein
MIFLWALLLSVVAVILASGFRFLIKKDYNFLVETQCDPAAETCFVRDCSEPDTCPPNELEQYRVFSIAAADYFQCASDDSCLQQCTTGAFVCEEMMCGDSEEDACAPPDPELATESEPAELSPAVIDETMPASSESVVAPIEEVEE